MATKLDQLRQKVGSNTAAAASGGSSAATVTIGDREVPSDNKVVTAFQSILGRLPTEYEATVAHGFSGASLEDMKRGVAAAAYSSGEIGEEAAANAGVEFTYASDVSRIKNPLERAYAEKYFQYNSRPAVTTQLKDYANYGRPGLGYYDQVLKGNIIEGQSTYVSQRALDEMGEDVWLPHIDPSHVFLLPGDQAGVRGEHFSGKYDPERGMTALVAKGEQSAGLVGWVAEDVINIDALSPREWDKNILGAVDAVSSFIPGLNFDMDIATGDVGDAAGAQVAESALGIHADDYYTATGTLDAIETAAAAVAATIITGGNALAGAAVASAMSAARGASQELGGGADFDWAQWGEDAAWNVGAAAIGGGAWGSAAIAASRSLVEGESIGDAFVDATMAYAGSVLGSNDVFTNAAVQTGIAYAGAAIKGEELATNQLLAIAGQAGATAFANSRTGRNTPGSEEAAYWDGVSEKVGDSFDANKVADSFFEAPKLMRTRHNTKKAIDEQELSKFVDTSFLPGKPQTMRQFLVDTSTADTLRFQTPYMR